MATSDIDAMRNRIDYKLKCGHRGQSKKGRWQMVGSPGPVYCPRCSAKPEPVACDHEVHQAWEQMRASGYRWRYCPRCGVALPKRET